MKNYLEPLRMITILIRVFVIAYNNCSPLINKILEIHADTQKRFYTLSQSLIFWL